VADDELAPYVHETRTFFGPRAAGWDDRFPDDAPDYARGIAALGLAPGSVVLDLGCGTGRALPHLRAAVGPDGCVIGADATPEMLQVAVAAHKDAVAHLVLADAMRPPLRPASVDLTFTAGLVEHVPDPVAMLQGVAAITRGGGRIALFHPAGRARAHRHHHADPHGLLAPDVLSPLLRDAGWALERVDDADAYFLATARLAP
jgi:SAM-dependent methyltransferase